jgi:DNA-dependent RNA polymerase
MIHTYDTDFNLFTEKYISVSKEPFQFMSSFLSYYNYIKHNIETKIPILFDASCSGIQHLSALTSDVKIAKLVNLLSNKEPSDFYQYCIEKIKEIIQDLPNDELNIDFKEKMLSLKLSRQWLKHSIMTIPYNVTEIGITEKLLEHFDSKFIELNQWNNLKKGEITLTSVTFLNKNERKTKESKHIKGTYIYLPNKEIISNFKHNNLYFTNSDLIKFAFIIKKTVLNIIPPFNQLKIYFDSIIDIMEKLNLTIY